MKKEIRTIQNGIVQITSYDERWYCRPTVDPVTGLPDGHTFVPAVTWITSYYPKGIAFHKWLASKGWDEAEAIKAAAGGKGSKVHQAAWELLRGKTIPMTAAYVNPNTGQPEELTLDEYEALLAFRDFCLAAQPQTWLVERTVWHPEHGYAGTLDWFGRIETEALEGFKGSPRGFWLLDLKTGQEVWPEHELQVSAYYAALLADADVVQGEGPIRREEWFQLREQRAGLRLGILQVGYRRNQRKWKLTEVTDRFDLFLAAKAIWARETEGVEVFHVEYPLEITLNGPPGTPEPISQPTPKRRKPKAEQEAML